MAGNNQAAATGSTGTEYGHGTNSNTTTATATGDESHWYDNATRGTGFNSAPGQNTTFGDSTAPTHGSALPGTHHQTQTGHSPTAQAILGKLEVVAGTLISSQTLKAKGEAKVADADASREKARADHLDGEAMAARERGGVHERRGDVAAAAHQHVGGTGTGMGVGKGTTGTGTYPSGGSGTYPGGTGAGTGAMENLR